MSAAQVAAAVSAIGLVGYMLMRPMETVSAQTTDAASTKTKLVRRHSSGDHAFLPQKQELEAKKAAKKNYGVQEGQVQDSAGTRLPTTRGY
mmetsp:Transcript_25280/g.81760  ORF Transcript_25280/g.81760 Transcript_25280/m.81760 type:complete len:91 (-) Transcript_25280:586-858(-)